MKSLLFNTIIFCLFTVFGYSQSGCSKYYPMKEGTSFQYTNYDKKGKVSGYLDYKVSNVHDSGGNTTATFEISMKDKKEEHIMDSSYDISCNGSGVIIDYKSMSNAQMLKQFENFEYEISGTDIDLPNNLSVGQKLKDGNMNMKISMGITMEMKVTIKDREIVGKETITTPAGTFECYIMTSTLEIDMMKIMESSSKQWIAEGVGMVKQESYDKNGKLTNNTMLTKFN